MQYTSESDISDKALLSVYRSASKADCAPPIPSIPRLAVRIFFP
jgi:hypothetical protein